MEPETVMVEAADQKRRSVERQIAELLLDLERRTNTWVFAVEVTRNEVQTIGGEKVRTPWQVNVRIEI